MKVNMTISLHFFMNKITELEIENYK